MLRRPSRPPPAGFSISLPPVQKSVTVENRSAEDVRNQLYICGDDSMVSPIISSDVPLFGAPHPSTQTQPSVPGASAGGSMPIMHHHQQHHQPKFLHVRSTDIYILVDGGSLFHDDVPPRDDALPSLESINSFTSGGQSLRDRVLREMSTSSSCAEFDEALAEVACDTDRTETMQQRGPRGATAKCATSSTTGRQWSSGDFEGFELLGMIGGGQQGAVHVGRLRNGTRCAVKVIDIHDATSANNDAERQGRKAGIVRELNMVKSLRQHASPYLVAAFNASCVLKEHQKRLSIFMELMGPSVESLQKTIGRMPHAVVTRIRQQVFTKKYATATPLQATSSDAMYFDGSSSSFSTGKERVFTQAVEREPVDRQTQCPEIILSFLAHDVLRGLQDLHEVHRRVHCDLKPANILLSDDRRTFKIGDFGCAVMLGALNSVTQRGPALGSKIYRAPEQFRDAFDGSAATSMGPSSSHRVEGSSSKDMDDFSMNSPDCGDCSSTFDEKVDVWALGILLLELANGCHPTKPFQQDFWNFATKLQLKYMVLPVTCSIAFYEFIERCLTRDAKKRPSASDLLRHNFVRQYASVPRQTLPIFVHKLHSESEQFQRNERLESVRLSVVTATKTRDKELHKRKSAARWKGFTQLLVPGAPPSTTDENLFPPLGK